MTEKEAMKKKFMMLYCFRNRNWANSLSVDQSIDMFEGTKSELDTYIEKLKSAGCWGFDITEIE